MEPRSQFAPEVRLHLLEEDVVEIRADLAALRQTLNRVLWALAMAAVTLATSSVLFAANLLGGR
mgnify:CR=1 FL=1